VWNETSRQGQKQKRKTWKQAGKISVPKEGAGSFYILVMFTLIL
jgi:hypothetical protein